MFRLDGKVALVTGCGSSGEGWGNGQAIAVALTRQGAKIFCFDKKLQAAQRTANQITDEGFEVEVLAPDATSAVNFDRVVTSCIERFGRLDILINNVGQSEPRDPATMSEETWRQQIDINSISAFLGCKATLPVKDRQGKSVIVNISSVAGLHVMAKFSVSERFACSVLGQHRSTHRKKPSGRADGEALTADIIRRASRCGRYGYRRITAMLRTAGWTVNAGRLWLNDGSCVRLRPEHPNHVWSYDFVEGGTHNGRKFRMLNIIDEFTRECLAIRIGRKLNSTDVIDVLSDLFILRRVPMATITSPV